MGRRDLLISPPPLAAVPCRNLKHSAGIKSERTLLPDQIVSNLFPAGEGVVVAAVAVVEGDLLIQH